MKREDELERELMPYIVDKINKKIEKEEIDEEEITRISEELKEAGSPKTGDELRKEAVLVWKEELINQEPEKQVKEKLEK